MDSAATKTFDASSMAGRWDCTVLCCRWDCDYYGKTDPGGKYMQLFSFAWQSMFYVRFEAAVLPKLLKKWRLL